jgi:hypothetical protein
MIKLEIKKMTNAIKRARQVRPFVKWLGERRYSVTGSDRQTKYTVNFAVANGMKLAECNCRAGRDGMMCFHVAAAAAVNVAIASMRQQQVV